MIRYYLLFLLIFSQISIAGSIEEIQKFLNKGEASKAFELAKKNQTELEGGPAFDFVYGMAAMASGKPQLAVFAFERVLMLQPFNHRARLELGRAHTMQGNWKAAKTEFNLVLKQNPPENVQRRIKYFLDRIRKQQQSLSVQNHIDASITAGYSSNINSATSDASVTIPALGVVILGASNREIGAFYTGMKVKASMMKRQNKYSGFKTSIGLKQLTHAGYHEFDTTSLGIQGSYIFKKNKNRIEIPVQFHRLFLDSSPYRKLVTAGVSWKHKISAKDSASLYTQGGFIRYDTASERNVNLVLAGTSWTKKLAGAGKVFSASAFAGNEDAVNSNGAHYSRVYLGMRTGLQWALNKKQVLYGVLSVQRAKHKQPDPVFAVTRHDRYINFLFGWNKTINKDWSVKAKLDLADNNSNVPIYDYDRNQFSVTFSYRLK